MYNRPSTSNEGRKRVRSCDATILIRLLDPFESAAHGRIVDAQVCRDLIDPIALFIGLANRFRSPSPKDLLQRRLRSSKLGSWYLFNLLFTRSVFLDEGLASQVN